MRPPHRLAGVAIVLLLIVSALGLSTSSPLRSWMSGPAPEPVMEPAPTLGPLVPAEPLSDSATLRTTRVVGRGFRYCANGSLEVPATEVRRVIVVVHGNDRGACDIAAAVLAAATPQQRTETLVVAPWFPLREDRHVNPVTDLFWSYSGWSQGNTSANDDVEISSFAVVDELLDRAAPLPTVIVGFSGGGQFVGRYAAGTDHSPVRFVISNPSSYLYFTPQRPGVRSETLARCPGYNDYRYGLNGLNPYMARVGPQGLMERFGDRRVVYLLGDSDNDPRSSSMDKTCGAQAQGSHRFERGQRYWTYLFSVFGDDIRRTHRLVVVPEGGHNAYTMFQHPRGQEVLFG